MSCGKAKGFEAQVLVQTVWWLLTQYFGLEHHVEDFRVGLDENKPVEFIVNQTKVRQSRLSGKSRRGP